MSPFTDYLKFLLAKSIAVLVVAGVLIGGTTYLALWVNDRIEIEDAPFADTECNVAIIPVQGIISTLEYEDDLTAVADEINSLIYRAETADHIKGILLEIDSPGGHPVASEMIMDAVKRASKPTLALIGEQGTSGAYLAATGADHIMASRLSDIGGIGVTLSYVETAGEIEREGKEYIELTAGKYKDMGDPERPLTDEERVIIQRDLDITHDLFINFVAENRNIPVEDVKNVADGSTMMGDMALQNRLIDAIGDEDAAMNWFMDKIGEDEGVVMCE